jgi:hypothetical protein
MLDSRSPAASGLPLMYEAGNDSAGVIVAFVRDGIRSVYFRRRGIASPSRASAYGRRRSGLGSTTAEWISFAHAASGHANGRLGNVEQLRRPRIDTVVQSAGRQLPGRTRRGGEVGIARVVPRISRNAKAKE